MDVKIKYTEDMFYTFVGESIEEGIVGQGKTLLESMKNFDEVLNGLKYNDLGLPKGAYLRYLMCKDIQPLDPINPNSLRYLTKEELQGNPLVKKNL